MLLIGDWTISLLRVKPLINFAPNGWLIAPGKNSNFMSTEVSTEVSLLILTDLLPYNAAMLKSIAAVPLLVLFVSLAHSRMKHKPTALQPSLKNTPPNSPNKLVQLLIDL
jgi:hypothetical protein